jgi:hypothetical protein
MNSRILWALVVLVVLIGVMTLTSGEQSPKQSILEVTPHLQDPVEVPVNVRMSLDPETQAPVSWNLELRGVVVGDIDWSHMREYGWSEATVVSSEEPLHPIGSNVKLAYYMAGGYALVYSDTLVVENFRTVSSVRQSQVTSDFRFDGVEVGSIDWFNLREHGWSQAIVVSSSNSFIQPEAIVSVRRGVGENSLALVYSEPLTFAMAMWNIGSQIVEQLAPSLGG